MDPILHKYNDNIAKHYAAYRPALHKLILRRLIRPNEHFRIALDVGCGTGYSTIALSEYSDHVLGLDSNQAMLDRATMHPKISYFKGDGDDFSILEQNHFDVVSFAGSLSHTKSDRLKSELLRTLVQDGVVLIYDFQVLLDDLMARMNINVDASASNYNFEENFGEWPEFTPEIVGTDTVQLDLSTQEAAHILLANSQRYQEFQNRFHESDPFETLVGFIQKQKIPPGLEAAIFFSRYRMSHVHTTNG